MRAHALITNRQRAIRPREQGVSKAVDQLRRLGPPRSHWLARFREQQDARRPGLLIGQHIDPILELTTEILRGDR